MEPHHIRTTLLFSTVVLAILSLAFVLVGVRGLVTRRPFLFPSRALFVFMVFAFLPNFVLPFGWTGGGHKHGFDWMLFISPLMYVVILCMFWLQMRGYMIYGVTAESLMICLRRTLAKLNLPYQESLASIRLETLDAQLSASVQDWMGTAQLRIKPGKHADTLRAIAAGLKEEFVTERGSAGTMASVIYVLLGLIMLALALGLAMPHH